MTQRRTVRVATSHDPAEAAVIKSILSAHDIAATIPEGASSAGVMAVGFVTHVFVDAEDAEEATALIAELRASAPPELDDLGDADGGDGDDEAAAAPDRALNVSLERRTRIGAIVLIAVFIQFGTGHMAAGAWKRGFVLTGLELYGSYRWWNGKPLGLAVIAAAVGLDLLGAIVIAYRRAHRRTAAAPLPVARLRAPASRDPR